MVKIIQNCGYLGMGIMGASMAANLARSSKADVSIWNRQPASAASQAGIQKATEAGARWVPDLAEIGAHSDIVFTCLGDEKDVEQVIIGDLAPHLRSGTIVVDFSTIGPESARTLAAALQKKSCVFLDAPVTGGDVGARNGTLTIMVGGDRVAYDAALPLLQHMGKNVHHCGEPGSGQAMKMVNQILCAVNLVSVCEAFKAARDLDIDPVKVVDILENGAGGSWALTNLGRRINNGDLKPAFSIKHMLKDLRLVFENLDHTAPGLAGTAMAQRYLQEVLEAQGAKDADAATNLGTQAMIEAKAFQ